MPATRRAGHDLRPLPVQHGGGLAGTDGAGARRRGGGLRGRDPEETIDYKWVQPPDLTPTGIDVNARPAGATTSWPTTSSATRPGCITDVRVWGSWLDDYLPDGRIPTRSTSPSASTRTSPPTRTPTGYSMPGELLWIGDFQPGDFDVDDLAGRIAEGWMDPPDDYVFPGDTDLLALRLQSIPSRRPSMQVGHAGRADRLLARRPGAARSTRRRSSAGRPRSTTGTTTRSGATASSPTRARGTSCVYPPRHDMAGQSIDLAFALTDTEVRGPARLGRRPRRSRRCPATRPTTSTAAPTTVIVPGFFLGGLIDAEANGQPDATATGDDNAGLDDEDGVTFTSPMYPGYAATVDIVASNGDHRYPLLFCRFKSTLPLPVAPIDLRTSWIDPYLGVGLKYDFHMFSFSSQLDLAFRGMTSFDNWWLGFRGSYRTGPRFFVNMGWIMHGIEYHHTVLDEELMLNVRFNGPMLGISFHF